MRQSRTKPHTPRKLLFPGLSKQAAGSPRLRSFGAAARSSDSGQSTAAHGRTTEAHK